jgi:hypothetical protein
MATLDSTIDIQPTTPNPDFESEDEWKTSLKKRIEDNLKPVAEKLKGLSPPEDPKARIDYDNAIAELRRTANEQYRQLVERERQERRLAAGVEVDEKWAEILMREQEALLDTYIMAAEANQREAARDKGSSQSPPSITRAPDRSSFPPESIAEDRM